MTYRIGGHNISVTIEGGSEHVLDMLLPSFKSFKSDTNDNILFHLAVCENIDAITAENSRLIRDVNTGNGMTRVEKLKDGGYQFVVRNVFDKECALLITSSDFKKCRCRIMGEFSMKRFALNNCLMLSYAFASASHGTLLVHASVVRHKGQAYAFTAKSGTGKSTQVANWMRNIPDCDIVNDDNPIFRIIDGKPVLYGSPWSGKTPCYRNIKVPLGALLMIKRDEKNYVKPQMPLLAFSTLLTACSSMKWDENLFQNVCSTVSALVEKIKVAELHCLPNAESALVCKKYLEP